MMKNFIWMGIIIVFLISLTFWAVKRTGNMNPPFEVNTVHLLDNVEGNASSSVVVIEYSDFQCPACRTYYFVMKQLMVEFGGKVAFVYRHFPLTGMHANAELAARAAQAAGKQSKFWEMHDLLFEKQGEWSNAADVQPMFESYASLLGISVEQFKTDFMSKEIKNFVKAQRASTMKLGLPGTPTFFVDGRQIENPTSVGAFKTVINNVINNRQ